MNSHKENNNSQIIEGGKTVTQVGGNYIRRSIVSFNLVFVLLSIVAIASTFYFDIGEIKMIDKLPFVEFSTSQE